MGDIATTGAAPPIDDALHRVVRRDAFNAWFVTHEVAWELAMAALAIVYVALGFIVDDIQQAAADRPVEGHEPATLC
jgi:hypothetical protein